VVMNLGVIELGRVLELGLGLGTRLELGRELRLEWGSGLE